MEPFGTVALIRQRGYSFLLTAKVSGPLKALRTDGQTPEWTKMVPIMSALTVRERLCSCVPVDRRAETRQSLRHIPIRHGGQYIHQTLQVKTSGMCFG